MTTKYVTPNGEFQLNGVKERVLGMPTSRESSIKVTMGGREEFAETVSMEAFEAMTGHVFQGLEPVRKHDPSKEFAAFKEYLQRESFEISTQGTSFLFHTEFTNASDDKMSVSGSISKNEDGEYLSRLFKSGGWGHRTSSTFSAKEDRFDYLLSQIKEQLSKYTASRVQTLTGNEQNADLERQYDEHGIAILKPGETVKDYFKSQDMPAGVVKNAKEQYQAFTSYIKYDGTPEVTGIKSYKTLKGKKKPAGAEKYLLSEGFTLEGKFVDVLGQPAIEDEDTRDIKESKGEDYEPTVADILMKNIRRSLGTNYALSSRPGSTMAEWSNQYGSTSASEILSHDDKKFGTLYEVKLVFTRESDGRTLSSSLSVDPREGGNAYSISNKLQEFEREIISSFAQAKEPNFDVDNRTPEEKVEYHREKVRDYLKTIANAKESIDKYGDERGFWGERIEKFQAKIAEHKSSVQELKAECSKANSKNMDL